VITLPSLPSLLHSKVGDGSPLPVHFNSNLEPTFALNDVSVKSSRTGFAESTNNNKVLSLLKQEQQQRCIFVCNFLEETDLSVDTVQRPQSQQHVSNYS